MSLIGTDEQSDRYQGDLNYQLEIVSLNIENVCMAQDVTQD